MVLQRFSLGLFAVLAACVPGEGDVGFGTTGTSTSSGGGTGEAGTGEAIAEPGDARALEAADLTVPGEQLAPAELVAVAADADAEPPIGHRVARKTVLVFAEPRWGSALRGRIDMDNPFAIYEHVAGKGCGGEGWARVDAMGYACLKGATVSKRRGKPLPAVPAGRVVPYVYAKARADRAGELVAPAPRWRNAAALARGDAPRDHLEAHHQYAFVASQRVPGVGVVYLDRSRRAVRGDALQLERPSEFAGRDLLASPIPEGAVAAWAAEAPVLVRAEPGAEARVIGRVEYHREIHVAPHRLRRHGVDWYALHGGDGAAGFVSDEDIRRWIPGAPLAEEGRWLDVELSEQTLAVYEGATPVFVTLISSGAGDNPTPRGVYRIWHKQALGDMSSLPGAEDSYTVEDVPWVMYFHGRFALHAAFWHNKFGRRRSHGCVNLAPRDAAYVFGATAPAMPPGWTFVYEHEDEPGTTVRIRKGTAPVADRRREIGVASDEVASADDAA
jgi:lipoprotein-anchoring transpeptidase ErfK/SrfK